jgi:hypothetical protein
LAITESRRISQALERSGKKLAPLGDPLLVTLGDHRWLRYDREESYSDWLAWVVTTMRPEEILGVLGLAGERELAAAVCDQQAKVIREKVIETSGGVKRLDLVVCFGTAATLLVETKRTSYERAGNLPNLTPYHDWLEKERGQKKAILLVTEAAEVDAADVEAAGWQLLTWRDVGLALRRRATVEIGGGCKAERLLKVALWLCFAGAIEQNLLGLEVGAAGASALQTERYLEEFLL